MSNINFLNPRGCHARSLSSSCLIFFRPIFLQLQLKEQKNSNFHGFDVQSDIFCVGVCRVWSVVHVERSSRDLGLAVFDPCVNMIFPAVLFNSNELHTHVSIQIGKMSLRKRKTDLYEVFLRL